MCGKIGMFDNRYLKHPYGIKLERNQRPRT